MPTTSEAQAELDALREAEVQAPGTVTAEQLATARANVELAQLQEQAAANAVERAARQAEHDRREAAKNDVRALLGDGHLEVAIEQAEERVRDAVTALAAAGTAYTDALNRARAVLHGAGVPEGQQHTTPGEPQPEHFDPQFHAYMSSGVLLGVVVDGTEHRRTLIAEHRVRDAVEDAMTRWKLDHDQVASVLGSAPAGPTPVV